MKDQDNKTNVLCYCKEQLLVQRTALTDDTKTSASGKQLKKIHGDREQPWSVFGEWYWI
jgi:hypothetical protein